MTPEDIAKAQELRDSGLSNRKVGAILGVNGETIRYNLDADLRAKSSVTMREWRLTHITEKYEGDKLYREEHIEKYREYSARYLLKHPEMVRKSASRWAMDNKPKLTAKSAKRRALIKGATIGNLEEIAEIYRQAREDEPIRCYLCGELIPLGDRHVDHKYPLSKGGDHTPSNLAIACATCNLKKSDKILDEDLLEAKGR